MTEEFHAELPKRTPHTFKPKEKVDTPDKKEVKNELTPHVPSIYDKEYVNFDCSREADQCKQKGNQLLTPKKYPKDIFFYSSSKTNTRPVQESDIDADGR